METVKQIEMTDESTLPTDEEYEEVRAVLADIRDNFVKDWNESEIAYGTEIMKGKLTVVVEVPKKFIPKCNTMVKERYKAYHLVLIKVIPLMTEFTSMEEVIEERWNWRNFSLRRLRGEY